MFFHTIYSHLKCDFHYWFIYVKLIWTKVELIDSYLFPCKKKLEFFPKLDIETNYTTLDSTNKWISSMRSLYWLGNLTFKFFFFWTYCFLSPQKAWDLAFGFFFWQGLPFSATFYILVMESCYHTMVWCVIISITKHIKLIAYLVSNLPPILVLPLFTHLQLRFWLWTSLELSIWVFLVLVCMCKGSKESWCGSRGVGYANKGNEGAKVKAETCKPLPLSDGVQQLEDGTSIYESWISNLS